MLGEIWLVEAVGREVGVRVRLVLVVELEVRAKVVFVVEEGFRTNAVVVAIVCDGSDEKGAEGYNLRCLDPA